MNQGLIVYLGPLLFIAPFFFLTRKKFSVGKRWAIVIFVYIASFFTGRTVSFLGADAASYSVAGVFAPLIYLFLAYRFVPASENTLKDEEKNRQQKKKRLPKNDTKEKIFISYRRSDSNNITGRIYDRLAQHFGREAIFKDVDSIPLGVDFRQHLHSAVGECEILLVIIGKSWLAATDEQGAKRLHKESDFVRIEIEAALGRNISVIPVLVENSEIPQSSELPASLANLAFRNGIQVRHDPDFHRDMDRLIRDIEEHLGR